MKNTIKFLAIAGAVLLALAACKEDKLIVHGGEDNVYFRTTRWPSANSTADRTAAFSLVYQGETLRVNANASSNRSVDSLHLTLGFVHPDQVSDTIFIPVRVMGSLKPYERKVGWEIVDRDSMQAVEGVDFKILDAYVPANRRDGGIVIELFRENVNQDTTLEVKFRLIENEHFKVNFNTTQWRESSTDFAQISTLDMRLLWYDGLPPPLPAWNYAHINSNTTCHREIGAFSLRKVFVLVEQLGVPWENIYKEDGTAAGSLQSNASTYGLLLWRWLVDYQEEHGVEYMDEDGQPMKSGDLHYL